MGDLDHRVDSGKLVLFWAAVMLSGCHGVSGRLRKFFGYQRCLVRFFGRQQ